MALIFMDGFDKYSTGTVNTAQTPNINTLLTQEWTTATLASNSGIVAGLSATGYALYLAFSSANLFVTKTLPASYSRLIGGFRFKSDLVGFGGIGFTDSGSGQCGITINGSTGFISLRNGAWNSATIIATSSVGVTANSVHYLEFDISFGNSANYQIWLDGISILSGVGDTTATANNSANMVGFGNSNTNVTTIDDFYLFDTSGTTNNAVLLTSPRIETQFPNADNSVQFASGSAVLGSGFATAGNAITPSANQFRLHPYTPSVNMTINSIVMLAATGNGSLQLRPLVYADSAGLPGTLMSTGSTVIGTTTGVAKVMPLTTPQSLSAGTQYWIGFMSDLNAASLFQVGDTAVQDRVATVTFSGGAPSTAPATAQTASAVMFGLVTVTGNNWYEVSQNPSQGNNSYVFDATVGHEDLYQFPSLTAPTTLIYAVAMKGNASKSDAGAKTMSMRMKSGAVDSGGSAASLTPATSYTWMTSYFNADPANGLPWTLTGLNTALGGIRVES